MKKIVIITVIALLVAGSGFAFYKYYHPQTNSVYVNYRNFTSIELAKEADLILVGTFKGKTERISNQDDGYKLVSSDWTIDPLEVWKGDPPKQLVVSILGGKKYFWQTASDLQLDIKPGLKVLMYLVYEPVEKIWILITPMQGILVESNGKYINQAEENFTEKSIKDEIKNIE